MLYIMAVCLLNGALWGAVSILYASGQANLQSMHQWILTRISAGQAVRHCVRLGKAGTALFMLGALVCVLLSGAWHFLWLLAAAYLLLAMCGMGLWRRLRAD